MQHNLPKTKPHNNLDFFYPKAKVLNYNIGIAAGFKIFRNGILLTICLFACSLFARASNFDKIDTTVFIKQDFTDLMVDTLPKKWSYNSGTEHIDFKVVEGTPDSDHEYYLNIVSNGSSKSLSYDLIPRPDAGFFILSFWAKSSEEVTFLLQLMGNDWTTHLVYERVSVTNSWKKYEFITELVDDQTPEGYYLTFNHNIDTGNLDIDDIELTLINPDKEPPNETSLFSLSNNSPSAIEIKINHQDLPVDFSHYTIYRDEEEIAQTTELVYMDEDLSYDNTYSYQIGSSDVFGNAAISNEKLVTTRSYNTVKIRGKDVYLNGLNIAIKNWVDNDFAPNKFKEDQWEEVYGNIAEAGGNATRHWMFYNPEYMKMTDDTLFYKISDTEINNIEKLLDIAHENNILVTLTFTSFEMCYFNVYNYTRDKLVNTDEGIYNFIDSVITPVVSQLYDHPGLAMWEIMNEPEWAIGHERTRITDYDMQRFIGKCAAAIHKIDPEALVTTGCATAKYLLEGLFSDATLKAAAEDELAYMDIYQFHYYEWMHPIENRCPWDHIRGEDFDKPTIIGELPMEGDKFRGIEEMYVGAIDRGYVGAWGWMYFDASADRAWPSGQSAIQAAAERIGETTTITTESVNKDEFVKVYPNPAHDIVFLELKKSAIVKIYSLNGELYYSYRHNYDHSSLNEQLPAGNYILLAIDESTGDFSYRQIQIK